MSSYVLFDRFVQEEQGIQLFSRAGLELDEFFSREFSL
jgi:hypothetical protein